jgi:hypothetical protein
MFLHGSSEYDREAFCVPLSTTYHSLFEQSGCAIASLGRPENPMLDVKFIVKPAAPRILPRMFPAAFRQSECPIHGHNRLPIISIHRGDNIGQLFILHQQAEKSEFMIAFIVSALGSETRQTPMQDFPLDFEFLLERLN